MGESEAAITSAITAATARRVYQAAIKALPQDLQLRREMLEATKHTPLPAASNLGRDILADLRMAFRQAGLQRVPGAR